MCVFSVGGFFLVLAINLKIFHDFLIFPTGDFYFSCLNNGFTIDYEILCFLRTFASYYLCLCRKQEDGMINSETAW